MKLNADLFELSADLFLAIPILSQLNGKWGSLNEE